MQDLIKKIRVKNETCLITGATGKIGEKTALMMAACGYNLILTDNNFKKLKIIQKKILKNSQQKIFIINCDLSLYKAREKLIKIVGKKFRDIKVLINNAAKTGKKENKIFGKNFSFKEKDLKDWNSHIEINMTAIHHITSKLSKLLLKNKNPKIINIGSIYSFIAPTWEIYKGLKMNNKAAYSASKGGLLQLTRWQSTFYAPKIKVNMISPGGIIRDQKKSFILRYSKKTPLKKMASEDDIVDAILFLSSDLSNYITGQNLVVDGGISIQ